MHKPDVICFLETKAEANVHALRFMAKFGFDKQFKVDSQGRAGGLWLFWKSSTVYLDIIFTTSQFIHCSISNQHVSFLITFVYVQPHGELKNVFWETVAALTPSITGKWIAMGDFNDIISVDEASPRAVGRFARAQKFRDRLDKCGLQSKDALGCAFTWIRKSNGRIILRERLDRALFNFAALEAFPDAKLLNLPRLCSDHHPIMLCIDTLQPSSRCSKPLRFEAAWLTHANFGVVFSEAWLANAHSLTMAISSVREACTQWNKNVFGDLFHKKRHLHARLTGIQNSQHYLTSQFLQSLEVELLDEYHKVLHAEELFWCQKSRHDWIASGDQNTRFYHASTIIRRGRNRISTLKIDGTWVYDPQLLKQHVHEFFQGLFAKKATQATSHTYSEFQPGLSAIDNASLLAPISIDEVKFALFSMKGLKSPGPDGIQPIFYQKHWNVVSGTLHSFVNKALIDGFFDHWLLQAHIALIPKGESPDVIQKFRPICLLNVAYKVLSKVIVNRLRPHLQHLIGPLQSSFLAGRSTTDNIILSQEAIHSMRRMKGRKGAMAFKIDLHKAFDSVDWDFLHSTLVDFNLPGPLIKLIMFSVTTLQLSILWNGEELPYFTPQRGLRQGDPLSPYLFIMVMEKLSHMILSRVQQRLWKPFQISRGGFALSHLFFADDLMLFCEASHSQVDVVMDCLTEFSNRSGLDINLAKSKLFISPNVQSQVANSMSSSCGIPLTHNLGVYLGVPIIHGRSTSATYKYIVEKIQLKLSSWKQSLLSLAGRRVLVQSITSSIPIYTMQTVLLPRKTCAAIDSLNRKFLWGSDQNAHKPHLVNWNDVCLPRKQGGLGLRPASENNRALIAKLGWQLLTDQNKPWCQALSQKYLRKETFMDCQVNSSSSITWRSILRCRDVLQLGSRWRVGSGSRINFWHDIWVDSQPLLQSAISPIPLDLANLSVSHFITEDKRWNLSLLVSLLPQHILNSIAAIPIPIMNQLGDERFWHASKNGDFTVSSAFSIIQSQRIAHSQTTTQWDWIWKLKCSERIKMFVWLLQQDRVLTNSVRFDRHFASSPMCPRCGQAVETPIHLLRDCYFSKLVWEVLDSLPPDFFVLDLRSWLFKNSTHTHLLSNTHTTWASLFLSVLWFIWKSRNKLLFEGIREPPAVVFWQARAHALDTFFALNSSVLATTRTPRWVGWQPPAQPFVKLNTDGSRNHQSGSASAGGLIRDHLGRWVHGFTVNIGVTSSFIAELWGCREGLKLAHSLHLQYLILEMDSLMAIHLIQTRQVQRGPYSVLLSDILVLLYGFSTCIVRHTLREGNSAADFMASLGHKSSLGATIYPTPPAGISMFLHGDAVGTMFLRS
ncbi:hypothetical protein SLA2020_515820 [Shorea laevis]